MFEPIKHAIDRPDIAFSSRHGFEPRKASAMIGGAFPGASDSETTQRRQAGAVMSGQIGRAKTNRIQASHNADEGSVRSLE